MEDFHDMKEFADVDELCRYSWPPTCVAVPVSSLGWHLHASHVYNVSLRLQTVTGLSTVVTSEPYQHFTGPPEAGIVIELPLDTLYSEQYDPVCMLLYTTYFESIH